jgi:hypothetical protein
MKFFVVYRPATGEVVRAGACQPCDLPAQAGAGEAVLEVGGALDPRAVRVENGAAVPLAAN